jgi:hypothetical protein
VESWAHNLSSTPFLGKGGGGGSINWAGANLFNSLTTSGPQAGQGVLQCGKWYLRASFGVYGRKWMIETLRMGRGLWGKLFLYSLKLCIFAQQRMCLLCQLVLVTFLFILLFLVKWFLLYISYIFKGALRFQWNKFITY